MYLNYDANGKQRRMQKDLKRLRIITMHMATSTIRVFKDDDAGMLQCEMQSLARLKFDRPGSKTTVS
jgi:hypothetical protein